MTTPPPAVSVIIPVHNVSEYLDECLHSIAQQSLTDFEVLLVDDGSTDRSGVMCDEWGAREPRVRVIHQDNRGSSVARNVGIELARGGYLTFIDADDVVAPDFLSELYRLAATESADLVVSQIVAFTDTAPQFRRDQQHHVQDGLATLHDVVCVQSQWGPMAKLYRAGLFDDLRFPEGLVHQDLYLVPRLVASATRAVVSQDALYGYRQREGSITDLSRSVQSPDLITILRDNIEHTRRTVPPESFLPLLAAYALHASKVLENLPAGDGWRRNRDYVSAYQGLAREYQTELFRSGQLSGPYTVLWWISARSPRVFRAATGMGHRLKSAGVLGLRRGARR